MDMYQARDCCEFVERCGFLKKHFPEKKGKYAGWFKSFCNEIEKSRRCRRKRYLAKYDVMPPDDMTPEGLYI